MDIFTTGMKYQWPDLVYADLFSGPGLNVEEGSGDESLGSPLRALQFPFARRFLSDADPVAVDALRSRAAERGARGTLIQVSDCNEAIETARQFLFPPEHSARTLGLAFIDPTAFQVRFESIRRLVEGVRLDLIITFMTGHVRRFLDLPGFGEGSDLDAFMGTRDWLRLRRSTPGFTRELLDVYKAQLSSLGYNHVVDSTRIQNTRGSTIYHLVFASRSERGADFFEKISQRTYSGLRRLPGF